MAEDSQRSWIVSLEGNAELIASQLRLLPPSSNILTLPPLPLPSASAGAFDPCAYIRAVNESFSTRCARVHSFLQASTPAQPRIVFLNGGCVAAREACISKIALEITGGEVDEAEQIFRHLVKNGLALDKPPSSIHHTASNLEYRRPSHAESWNEKQQRAYPYPNSPSPSTLPTQDDSLRPEGHTFLDSETVSSIAFHDDCYSALDHHIVQVERRRKSRLPAEFARASYPSAGFRERASSFPLALAILPHTTYVPHSSPPTTTEESQPTQLEHPQRGQALLSRPNHAKETPTPLSPLSPGYDDGNVELGEAFIVNLPSPGGRPVLRKARSASHLAHSFPSSLAMPYGGHPRDRARSLGHLDFATLPQTQATRQSSVEMLSPTVFVRAASTHDTAQNWLPTNVIPAAAPQYVDRGAGPNASEVSPPSDNHHTCVPDSNEWSCEPILPLVEDLVVHLVDQQAHEIIELVIRSFKCGLYSPPQIHVVGSESSSPATPHNMSSRPVSVVTVESDNEAFLRRHEAELYNLEISPLSDDLGSPSLPWHPRSTKSNFFNSKLNLSLATPITKSSSPDPQSEKFVELTATNIRTPLGVQNALRALLNLHFPPSTTGFKQFSRSSQHDRCWKPILRQDDGLSSDGRTVDLILAIGYAENVSKTLFHTVAGQIEQFGRKRSGLTRSSNLDIRYLINNVLHIVTCFGVAGREEIKDPLSHPSILAEMILPQLEAFLSCNGFTRFLVLKYDPATLPTVLELRRLIGEDAFKVAGIKDCSDSPSIPHNVMAEDSQRSPRRPPDLLCRANFVLSSTATPAESNTFLDNIRNVLVWKDSFYECEPDPKPPNPEPPAAVQPPLTPSPSLYRNRLGPLHARSGSRSIYSDRSVRPATAGTYDPWEGFYDSEDDEMDRIFMPIVPRSVQRKGNSKKALKWLGLA
ncbi:MAG: hypothetical protein M1829_001676 [Trizodia sp. TS-e1964]|nr:MAG: hypothetical protein M1829_001676 [Trizodia sp. TS-e1964]